MGPAVLIYDGECPVCVKAAGWVRDRSGPEPFELLSCHSKTREERFPYIGKTDCLRAMHLVLPNGTVLIGEEAAREIFARLPRYRWCASLFRLPGSGAVSRIVYRWFARKRHLASRVLS